MEFEAKTGNLNAAAKAMERLDRVSQAFTKTAQTIETGFARINAAFEAATAKATVAAKAFDLLNKSRADLGMKGGAAAADALGKAVGNVSIKIDASTQVYNRHNDIINNVSKTYNRATTNIRNIEQAARPASNASNLLQNGMSAAASSGGGLTGAIMAGASAFPGYGQAVMAASAALSGFKNAIDAVVNAGKGTELVRNELQALLPAGEDGAAIFAQMKARTLELSASMGITQDAIFKTFSTMIKGGATGQQALDRIATTLKLSTAEGTSAEKSATSLTLAWNAFGKESVKAGKTIDDVARSLVAASNAGNIDNSAEITQALKTGAEASKLYGNSLDQTLAILTMLSNANIVGSSAGNKMKGVILGLTSASAKSKDALQQLGVSVTDDTGKMRPFVDVLSELQRGFSQFGGQKRLNLAEQLFGRENMAAGLTLISQGKDEFIRIQGEMAASSKQLDRLFAGQNDSQNAALARLSVAWKNLLTVFDEIIARPLVGFWDSVSGGISDVTSRIATMKEQFLGLIAQFENEGNSPLQSWFLAFEEMDWSAALSGISDAMQPAIDLALKLAYTGAAEFSKFMVRATPRMIVEGVKIGFNTAIALAKEAANYVYRLFMDRINAMIDGVKGVWNRLTGKKPTAPEQAALPASPEREQAKSAADYEAEIDAIEEQTSAIEQQTTAIQQQKSISEELQDIQKKRLDALEQEKVQRAAILQMMDKSLSAEAAMQQAGTAKGMAQAEWYQSDEKRKESAAAADRAKALLLSRNGGVSFDAAMQTATGDRLKSEGLDAISAMLSQAQKVAVGVDMLPLLEEEAKERQREHGNTAPGRPRVETLPENFPGVLSPYQKAEKAISFPEFQQNIEAKKAKEQANQESRYQAAKIVGTNERYISDMKRYKDEAPEIYEAAKDGKINGNQAKALSKVAPEKRKEYLEKVITDDLSGNEIIKAAKREEQQEKDELKAVEIEKRGAQQNVALLASKKDSSASEAVGRLGALMESYKSLGDVAKVKETAAALQRAQAAASGESVGILKQILDELRISRKASSIEREKAMLESKDIGLKSLDTLNRIKSEAGAGFDPAFALPTF